MSKNVLAQTIGANIREFRKKRGMSQAYIAEWSDIAQCQVWNYEHGINTPSVKTLEKICGCLGVSATDILGF